MLNEEKSIFIHITKLMFERNHLKFLIPLPRNENKFLKILPVHVCCMCEGNVDMGISLSNYF